MNIRDFMLLIAGALLVGAGALFISLEHFQAGTAVALVVLAGAAVCFGLALDGISNERSHARSDAKRSAP